MNEAPETRIDLGHGYDVTEYQNADGVKVGYMMSGPASPRCKSAYEGRCGGLIPTVPKLGKGHWTVIKTDPLTLTPSCRCNCDVEHPGEGQHGFITDGRWVNAGGILG